MPESRERSPLEPDLVAVPAAPLPNRGVPNEADRRWRRIAHNALLILFVLFAILALIANWLASELLDDDRYVDMMSALAGEPAIQDVVAQAVSSRFVDRFLASGAAGTSPSPGLSSTEGLTRLAAV